MLGGRVGSWCRSEPLIMVHRAAMCVCEGSPAWWAPHLCSSLAKALQLGSGGREALGHKVIGLSRVLLGRYPSLEAHPSNTRHARPKGEQSYALDVSLLPPQHNTPSNSPHLQSMARRARRDTTTNPRPRPLASSRSTPSNHGSRGRKTHSWTRGLDTRILNSAAVSMSLALTYQVGTTQGTTGFIFGT